jgi:hypothetical protein
MKIFSFHIMIGLYFILSPGPVNDPAARKYTSAGPNRRQNQLSPPHPAGTPPRASILLGGVLAELLVVTVT